MTRRPLRPLSETSPRYVGSCLDALRPSPSPSTLDRLPAMPYVVFLFHALALLHACKTAACNPPQICTGREHGQKGKCPFHARLLPWDSDRDSDAYCRDGDGLPSLPQLLHPTSRNLSSFSLSPPSRYLMQRWPRLTGATFSTCRLSLNSPGTSYLAVYGPAHML